MARSEYSVGAKFNVRSGAEARIYALDGCEPYPMHGAVLGEHGWEEAVWTRDGKYHADKQMPSGLDLEPARSERPPEDQL